jgi:hypothetical protein
MEIKSYIEDLFKYIDAFEKRPAQFETEAFFQTYNGIYAVFQALREQRDQAIEVDHYFLDRIKQSSLTSSDLREIVMQIMITYFESEADTDGQTNQSYLYCRGLRTVRQDIPFFESRLIPLLFKEGSLGGNLRLCSFLLSEISRYINKFGKKIHANLNPEDFGGLSEPMKFLELARRRLEFGTELIKDRSTLEFHLSRVNAFGKLEQKGKIYSHFLKEWGYLRRTSFWSKVKGFFSELMAKLKGAFSSGKYFRLVVTQRNPAYLFYVLIIMIFIFLAIYVPISWMGYSENKLNQFRNHANKVQSGEFK